MIKFFAVSGVVFWLLILIILLSTALAWLESKNEENEEGR